MFHSFILKFVLASIFWILTPVLSRSQTGTMDLEAFLSSPQLTKKAGITRIGQVSRFYLLNGYQPVWLSREGRTVYSELCRIIRTVRFQALDPRDYATALTEEGEPWIEFSEPIDSMIGELRICDAAISLFTHLLQGKDSPEFGYDGLSYSPSNEIVIQGLLMAVREKDLSMMFRSHGSLLPQVNAMLPELAIYLSRMSLPGFTDDKVISGKVSSANAPLCRKLFALGCTDTLLISAPDSLVRKAVQKAQVKFDLLNDGILRSTTLEALNIPMATRVDMLEKGINYYRWLSALTQKQPVIVVNIPAAYLKVFRESETVLEMRLVVGKPSTPTPALTSHVSEVILYPYWVVPSSIIINEILPVLRKDPGYIDSHNFQVLDKNGRILDPYKIDWGSVGASNFPYMIRQSTGCDNSLGLLKLNFYNPYTVYLHDTPRKSLFMTKRRYYSHGCMRMENPLELGRLILGENRIAIDTLEEKGCLKNQRPIVVPATHKLAVVVWYNPVDISVNKQVVFYEDVYRKFRKPTSRSTNDKKG